MSSLAVKICVLLTVFAYFPSAFGMGGMLCEGKHGKKRIALSWSTSRLIGNPRFGAFFLKVDNQSFFLKPKYAAKNKPRAKSNTKEVDVQEVGYWLTESQLYLKLTDQQGSRVLLHLLPAPSSFQKGLPEGKFVVSSFLEVYDPGISRKFHMTCSPTG